MAKHLLPKAQFEMLEELTELKVTELTSSTVDESALAIMRRPECQGITIVRSQRIFKLDIQV